MGDEISMHRISLYFILILLFPLMGGYTQAQFTDSGFRFESENINTIKFADVNEDGYEDAFVTRATWNQTNLKNELWLNDRQGRLYRSDTEVGKDAFGVSLKDLDGDGDLDAFLTKGCYGRPEPNEVWLNKGDGHFEDSGQRLGNRRSGAVLDDFDGDGDMDAFVTNGVVGTGLADTGNELWVNNGNGVFTNSGQDLGQGDHYASACGDIDGDGDIDVLVTANAATVDANENEIWINDGRGVFSKRLLPVKSYSSGLALADLDGDDDLDLIITHFGREASDTVGVWIYLNDGEGHFMKSPQEFDPLNCSDIALGDVDHDGDLDVLIGYGDWNVGDFPNQIWLNDGDGQFSQSDMSFGNSDGTRVAFVDIDNDGDLDALIDTQIWYNISSSQIIKEKGPKPTGFQLKQNFPNPFNPITTIHYSLSTDGNMEMVVFNLLGEKVKTLIQTYQTTGEHAVIWDGTDGQNNLVSTGTYMIQLSTNDQMIHKKMMFVR